MFTGLIEEVGSIRAIETTSEGSRITVSAQAVLTGVQLGDSIAIDGACTTVIDHTPDSFAIEASPETLSKTIFASYKPGRRVNLERPLTPQSRIGGHYVTGHVDGLARVVARYPEGNSVIYEFEMASDELASLLVPKGSVAVLGISLTVNTVVGKRFSVAIIPHTLSHTSLGNYDTGDTVNIETDLLGKYVQKLLSVQLPALALTQPSQPESGPQTELESLTTVPQKSTIQGNIHTGNWFHQENNDSVENSSQTVSTPVVQPYLNAIHISASTDRRKE